MTSTGRRRRSISLLFLAALVLLPAAGCGKQQIDGTYGRRRGTPGGSSVNGTAVLSEMFRQAGWKVATKRFLSPKIHQYDVIVWAPDDFGLPSPAAVSFLEKWLQSGQRRTLIYIGRDYDAQVTYWETFVAAPPPDQAAEILRRLARARAAHAQRRAGMPENESGGWFAARRDAAKRSLGRGNGPAGRLSGRWTQPEPIQADQLAIEIHGRLDPPSNSPQAGRGDGYRQETLLASGDDVLAYRLIGRKRSSNGQIVVIVNGSFLLNLPLVQSEHRKLAGRLIGDCGSAARVAFLESGAGGPPVLEQEPGKSYPTGLEAFTVWPLGGILWHFLALGVVFLFARLMVFGRPQELPPPDVADFGRHVHALGELLATTGDEQFARRQLARYQESIKPDAAVSRRSGSALPDRELEQAESEDAAG